MKSSWVEFSQFRPKMGSGDSRPCPSPPCHNFLVLAPDASFPVWWMMENSRGLPELRESQVCFAVWMLLLLKMSQKVFPLKEKTLRNTLCSERHFPLPQVPSVRFSPRLQGLGLHRHPTRKLHENLQDLRGMASPPPSSIFLLASSLPVRTCTWKVLLPQRTRAYLS